MRYFFYLKLLFITVFLAGCNPAEPKQEVDLVLDRESQKVTLVESEQPSNEPISRVDVNLIKPKDIAFIQRAIDGQVGRSQEDRGRDAIRKPAEVLAFLGLQQGMTVLDLFAGGGWYSEVLSAVVGHNGTVLIHNQPRVLAMHNGEIEKALVHRLTGNRLENTKRLNLNVGELGLQDNSIGMAITALNFHDMVYLMPGLAPKALDEIYSALKPGGVLGIIDHYGLPNNDNPTLHRIHPDVVRVYAEEAGFVVDAESTILRNSKDEISQSAFNAEEMPETSRFVLRLRK